MSVDFLQSLVWWSGKTPKASLGVYYRNECPFPMHAFGVDEIINAALYENTGGLPPRWAPGAEGLDHRKRTHLGGHPLGMFCPL